MDEMEEWEWTGNGIGDGGATSLSNALKSEETVLSSISLYGVFPFCQNTLVDLFCKSHDLRRAWMWEQETRLGKVV